MKEDLRVFRTKKLLRDSIFELAVNQSRKIAEITVQDICEQALVHRTTFYRYYKDKYDLLLQELKIEETLSIEERKQRLLAPFSLIIAKASIPDLEKLILLNLDDEHLQFLVKKIRIQTLTEDLNDFISIKSIPVPLEMAVKVYSTVLDDLVNYWLKNNTDNTPEQMDEYLRFVLNPFYFEILNTIDNDHCAANKDEQP
ncbi:TetR/AcrR family transcriptional regulator [Paenibacillus agricola]|uniref:TetR/AcrR family transcriptional regulator n=1 Tax=Paenibacillus agricola TaxID=2716264 RepID=A0ABX0J945_9BACL|nr:TetR/AcrR family transcriptional regulator [Paenibacillus agricola]NHN31714.1 TetR/AcrR family transcriptional regulator [Paenibacillus agricola]